MGLNGLDRKSLLPPPFPVSSNSSGRVKGWARNRASVRRRIMIIGEVKEMVTVGFFIES